MTGETDRELIDRLRADVVALEDILGQTYLYIGWRYLSKQMTTVEKERWADAIDAWSARLNDASDDVGLLAPRWWRDDYVADTADELTR